MTEAPDPSEESSRGRDWLLLAAATIAFGFGFGINTGTVPSFVADHLHVSPERMGLLESLREVPGLLTAGIIGLLAGIAEPRLAVVALALVAAGIGATGQAGSYWPLVACNLLWSLGLHIWLTVQPSLTLTLSQEGRHGYSLGLMSRYMAVAGLGGLLFLGLFAERIGFGITFLAGGAAVAVGTLFAGRIPASQGGGITQRLVFRRDYWRYYLLMLLDGGRRQVVQTFALLILVREFGASRETVAVLLLLNGTLTILAAPIVGRWTDHFGERRVLTVYYALVALVFFGYTRITGVAQASGIRPDWLFYGLFALDNLLFTGSVGIQTYIRHTAPRSELSASLAMGLTWNHVAAVTVPLAAGWVWENQGYERIFLYGIGLALTSFVTCFTLPRHRLSASKLG
ncbi:MAG: MFS transporter [Armatimonadota bacterium]